MFRYEKATQPTIYFIGVTTAKSSIMKVFPAWAEALKLENTVIRGIDFSPHSPACEYRKAVEFIKNDPLSLGALVTTHKIDLYNSCKDLFDYIDPYAMQLGEVSSISKKDGQYLAHAKLLEQLRRGCTPSGGRRKQPCHEHLSWSGKIRQQYSGKNYNCQSKPAASGISKKNPEIRES